MILLQTVRACIFPMSQQIPTLGDIIRLFHVLLLHQHGGAVRAANGIQGDLASAEGARVGGGRCWRLFVAQGGQFVDALEQTEEHEGHEEKVDQCRQKR